MSQRSKDALRRRPSQSKRDAELPPGRYAQDGPRLIGYGILLLALVLVVLGSAWA